MTESNDVESPKGQGSASSHCSQAIDLVSLLEQHDHYDLGDGWTVGRNVDHWNIYYRGKHVDAWRGESIGLSIREQINSDLKSYATAVEAIEVAKHDMTNGFFEAIASY